MEVLIIALCSLQVDNVLYLLRGGASQDFLVASGRELVSEKGMVEPTAEKNIQLTPKCGPAHVYPTFTIPFTL